MDLKHTYDEDCHAVQTSSPKFRVSEHTGGCIPLPAMLVIMEYCSHKDLQSLCMVNRQWNSLILNRTQIISTPIEREDISITKLPYTKMIELQNLSIKVSHYTFPDRLYHCVWYLNPQRLHIKCAYEDIQLNYWMPAKWLQKIPQIRIDCINKIYDTPVDSEFSRTFKDNLARAASLIKNIRSLKLTSDHLVLNNSQTSLIIRWRRPRIHFNNRDIIKLLNSINTAEELHLNIFLDDFDSSELETELMYPKID